MDHKQKGLSRFFSTACFESYQKIPRYISNGVATNWLANPMSDVGIVSIGQDSGIRNGRRKEVAGPVCSRVGAILALVGPREGDESRGF
jgi:hypothetical protein